MNRYPHIELSSDEPLVVQLFNVCQGRVDAEKLWNDHFDRALAQLDTHRSMRDLTVYARVIDNCLVLLLVSTDKCIMSTKSEAVHQKVLDHLRGCFPLTTKDGPMLECLNHRITQSSSFNTINQTPHILAFTKSHFAKNKHAKTDTAFRADRMVEDKIANAQPYAQSELGSLNTTFGEFQSTHGTILNCSVNCRLDIACAMARLGHFIAMPCHLGFLLTHEKCAF